MDEVDGSHWWLLLGLMAIALFALRSLVHGLAVLVAAWQRRHQPTPEPEHIETSRGGRIGRWGVALTDFAPRGKVRVQGVVWSAESRDEAEEIAAGQEIEVVGVEGLLLAVRAASASEVTNGAVVLTDRGIVGPVGQ